MKEYKVVNFTVNVFFNPKKHCEKLEEFLNGYARQGWVVKEANQSLTTFILERGR